MGAREDERRRQARVREVRARLGADIARLRLDAGLTGRAVAQAARISPAHYSGIESGRSESSTEVQVAIADVLGAELTIRPYPTTGPRLHDRIQAQIVEALLRSVTPRWKRFVEVAVRSPARGYVDLVLVDPAVSILLATEVQSDIRRLEQQLRWAQDKAASIPSTEIWRRFGEPTVDRLLVLRSTAHTRDIASRFADTLQAFYPAPCRAIHAAVMGDGAWPGPGILWVRVDAAGVRFLDGPPRGVRRRRGPMAP